LLEKNRILPHIFCKNAQNRCAIPSEQNRFQKLFLPVVLSFFFPSCNHTTFWERAVFPPSENSIF
jgi:hypothetical protein